MNLKQAQNTGRLKQFSRERDSQDLGDGEKLDAVIRAMAKKPESTGQTSRQKRRGVG